MGQSQTVTIGQLFISSDVFHAVVKRDIFSSFTIYIKLMMMMMMMIANMDTQLNFVPSHCPKILPVPFTFIYCITIFFVYTCLEKKWRSAYEPFKPWHTIDDETVIKLAPPQCQSFSIKSCLVFVNGLIASDNAVLKFSTEYLVQGGGFSWPFSSILHTSSSIPTRKASENHRAER